MLLSQDPTNYWFKCLIIIAFAMLILLCFKSRDVSKYYEGFSQDAVFVYKKNEEAHDDFYAEIYEKLMIPEERNTFVLSTIINITQPTPNHSVFLEIGSKTGSFVDFLQQKGFDALGIEKSRDLVTFSKQKYPKAKLKCGLTEEPLSFDKGSFTHIICNRLSFYEEKDKKKFFENCYFWLVSGGYLILHLVDPEKFDTIIPAGKPPNFKSPQQYVNNRITETKIDFIDYIYKAVFDFSNLGKTKEVTLKETFTDELTKNIRQNEFEYYMESVQEILQMAAHNGFIVKGQVNMEQCNGDANQYLVILERTQ